MARESGEHVKTPNQTGETGGRDPLALRLARLCTELGDALEEVAAEVGAGEALERLLAALRNGAEPGRLRRLLDDLDESLQRGGIAGGVGSYQPRSPDRYVGLPLSGGALEEVYACPTGDCARAEPILATGARPARCDIFHQNMRRVRLDR
ncbi:hypothetical protein [Nonomuraea diastatica]|uniref:Uncharacterized protein n=1 Tax=Nonomuraea diastatica TaxID=1848329 RepID=A0A4R4WS00_9ACTN|nr:hypothetical protein [Nonomuraea diastatica]TDD19710.1 hypothetical protein E1294_20195 [Nonomuraea diastatica]